MGLRTLRDNLRAVGSYFSTVRPLTQLVWRSGPVLFILSFSLMLLTGFVPAANILVVSALLDTLVQATQSSDAATDVPTDFISLLVLLAGINLLQQIVEHVEQAVSRLQGTRITNRVEMLIAETAAKIDLAGFEDPEFHNRMRTAANEAPYRPKMILDDLLGAVSSLTTLVSLATVLLFWQVWIVPVILVASLATLWASMHFGTAYVHLVKSRAETEREKFYLNTLFISDQAVKEIRLFGLREFLLNKFRGLLEKMYRQDRLLTFRELIYSIPPGIGLATVQAALIAFTAFRALQGDISIGQFNLYTQSIVQIVGIVPALMLTVGALHESNLFAAGLFSFLSTQPEVEAPRLKTKIQLDSISCPPHIEFRNVSFKYPGTNEAVLEDINFDIRPGESVALVGANGAGKSTLVKLLGGLYETTEGQILLNGVDVSTLGREDLRACLSIIFQDYVVYHFSARENVGLGQVSYLDDFARIENATQSSGLDEVVRKLPNGYDTVLGRFWESGHELSGGQRQLVALARALLRDAPILILDEPSAALDIHTEQRFFQRLLEGRTTKRTQTVVFISHRFTTVRRADRILVLENSRLIEQGSHEQLVAQGGRYADLFDSQAKAYTSNKDNPEQR